MSFLMNSIARRTQALRSQSNIPTAAAATFVAAGIYALYSSYGASSSTEPKKIFGKGPAFTSLELHSVDTLNHDTKRLRFALPKNAVSGLGLTSALLTFSRPQGQIFPVIRPYTPTSDLGEDLQLSGESMGLQARIAEPGFVDLVVKRYPKGKASNHLHSLQPGQSLFFLAAIPGYSWKRNEHENITLIAGGAGITPMYQLIQGIFKNTQEKTKVTLVFGINSDRDALFRDEFSQLEKRFPDRFKVIYTASNPAEGSTFRKGYVSKELLEEVVGKDSSKVFICGPPAFEESLLGASGPFGKAQGGILSQLGYSKDQVHKF